MPVNCGDVRRIAECQTVIPKQQLQQQKQQNNKKNANTHPRSLPRQTRLVGCVLHSTCS